MSVYVAGLDLGQVQDYTGLVIVQAHGTMRDLEYDGTDPVFGVATTLQRKVELPPIVSLDVRHIERFPLNTKYQAITEQVGARMKKVPDPKCLAIDQTGVGMGVFEMITAAGLAPIGVTITGGNEAQMVSPNQFRVPKRDLMAGLQVHLQNGTLNIAKGLPHASVMVSELQNFRMKISSSGHDTYEAWREADHDDLVLATAIAAWIAKLLLDIALQDLQRWLIERQIRKPYQISPI